MNILVLGVGNILLSDEGVGVQALAELTRSYEFPDAVELLDGGTAGIELLRHIADRDLLLIVDAMKSGRPPGTVERFTGEAVGGRLRTRISPHQLGLSDLLAAAAMTGEMPAEVILFGVEPENLEPGFVLSAPVAQALQEVVEMVVCELRQRGIEARPRRGGERFFWEEEGARVA